MHPTRTASICINDKQFGYVGELHPQIATNYGIGTKVYLSVIDMPALIEYADLVKEYQPLPKFPSVTRVISNKKNFMKAIEKEFEKITKLRENNERNEESLLKEIEKVIQKHAGQYLESITLFDVYQGKQIEKGLKSVAYSITFRATDKTLVDQDVTEAMKEIVDSLSNELQAQLRDK